VPIADRERGTLLRAVRLVASAAPGAAGQLLALTLTVGLLPVAQAWLSKTVVDGIAAVSGAPAPAAGSGAGGTAAVLVLALLFVLASAASSALEPVERTLTQGLTDHAAGAVDRSLIRAGGRMVDLHRIERPAFGDELRMVEQATHRLVGLLRGGSYLASALLGLAGLLALLWTLHPLLPPVLATLMVPHLFVQRRMQNEVYEYMDSHSRTAREMDYCMRLTTNPISAKEVRVFGTGDYFLRRFEVLRDRALGEAAGVRLRLLGLSLSLVLLDAAALAGGLWYTATQAAAGRLTAGDVALYVAAVLQAEHLLFRVPFGFGMLRGAQLHGRAFFAFLEDAQHAIRVPDPQTARLVPARVVDGVELRRVAFAYPGDGGDGGVAAGPILRDVTFTIPAGKVTALVGHNGAGKSTLVKLLTRLYDPASGEILLDDVALRDYELASLRARTGTAFQDFARFSLTLRENVAVGAGISSQADVMGAVGAGVERAAAWSGADEVAAGLPRGYETELTRYLEGGVELSGGQWQKVALARSAVRDGALVLLDEPTSALDADAEHRLLERLGDLMEGRTTLLISHRLSTVRLADHIVVLQDGRVVEQGSHNALVAAGGRYASLFEMQAGRYR